MPTPTKYTFSLATDFGGSINTGRLVTEIHNNSTIVTDLDGDRIDTNGDVIDIWFKDVLSAAEETELHGDASPPGVGSVLALHDSSASDQPVELVQVTNQPLTRDDGSIYAVPKPSTFGVEMCDRDFRLICSKYDDKALYTVVNGANGSVTYVSARSGAHGNDHSITVETGATGAGNEDRALAVARAGDDITVTFGTDSNGDSVTPTALAVADLINNDYDIAIHHLNAVPSGDGSGGVATVAQTLLTGGTTNSCEDLLVNTTTLKEESWGELTLIGIYKDDAGSIVECADQSDATTNAILSIWEYTAINPYTHDLLKYELRDGFLIVDPALPANERWDHRAYAIGASLIPGNLGGTIRLFDGYLGPAPNGVIDAESPQTTIMDPDTGPGTSSVRLYVYYPAGSTLSHVLRLVTYRPPGTF